MNAPNNPLHTKPEIDVKNLSVDQKKALIQEILRRRAEANEGLARSSHGQRAMWFLNQMAPESSAYNFAYAGRSQFQINKEAFGHAVDALVQRHAVLRSTYEVRGDELVQRISSHVSVNILEFDSSQWGDEHLLKRIREESDKPFDLSTGPVLRVAIFHGAGDEDVLMLCAHHIVADLWSMELLIRELWQLYDAAIRDEDANLPALQAQFTDYVNWEEELLSGPRGDALERYWKDQLNGASTTLNLPTDFTRPVTQTYVGDAVTWQVSDATAEKVRTFSHEQGVTPFVTLLTVFNTLLAKYSGQRDLLVGTTTANRVRPEWEPIVGYFLNQLVLRSDLTDDPTFVALLKRTRSVVLSALDNQDYPFPLLVDKLQVARDVSRSPLFQVSFIWDKMNALHDLDAQQAEQSACQVDLEPVLMEQRGAPFDLTLIVFEDGDSLSFSLRYNVDLYKPDTIERMARHLDTLLQTALDHSEQPVSELSMLTDVERDQVVEHWNQTETDWSETRRTYQAFEQHAASRPHAIAVSQGNQRWSYAELDERATALALRMQDQVQSQQFVGMLLPRGIDAIATILAVWKLNAAYVPLDVNSPKARLKAVLDDAQPVCVVTQSKDAHLLPEGIATVLVDRAVAEATSSETRALEVREQTENDLAYVIYTSGSTGKPKGVLVEHRGMINLLNAKVRDTGLKASDRFLQLNNLCFDATIWEMGGPLLVGATIVVPTDPRTMAGSGLEKLLDDQQVTIITAPPSILETLPSSELPHLRIIISAGEACPPELMQRWAATRTFFNAYGPTEGTVCATMHRCSPAEQGVPSIGRPIANQRIYLLDDGMQPVPVGVPGEMYIGGRGITRGYLNRPELTAQRFVPNPFWSGEDATLYRTGDMARYRADGTIEFMGRIDQQVKIRGHRIELGEIEANLTQHASVHRAMVIAQGKGSTAKLVSYVIPADGCQFDAAVLKKHAKAELPEYMVPAHVVAIESFPLTPNGKVDLKALPEVNDRASCGTEYVAPRNPIESTLVEIWKSVLGVKTVGIHDNFFDMGGASIQAIRVVDTAQDHGYDLAPEAIFQFQTVAELAEHASAHLIERDESSLDNTVVEQTPQPATVAEMPTKAQQPQPCQQRQLPQETSTVNVCFESLGVYLPPNIVSSDEVLAGCRNELQFPLERMTGIRQRHMCDGEYSIDLARRAVEDCLGHSKYDPQDVDLLICANISRYDGPQHKISFEPSTAMRLKTEYGFENAVAFDLSNACAGFFTAVKVAESYLRSGAAQRILVVSGEYISHLTKTAQLEIDGFMDPRLACLTLADSGLAAMIESSASPDEGLLALDLYTLGQFHELCVAKLTDQPHGGAIMITDPVRASAVTIEQAVSHAQTMLARHDWQPEQVDHLIMHQTSETTLDGAIQELNTRFGRDVCSRDNTIFNIAERGNTATTTHLVAVADHIRNQRIQSGDTALFAVTGSGQTVGTGLYRFDSLPDRLRDASSELTTSARDADQRSCVTRRARIESIGTLGLEHSQFDTVALMKQAGEACLETSSFDRSEIGLLIHSGVYRTEFLCEPALAAIAAGELDLNTQIESDSAKRTLAFDLMNGDVGTLNACQAAAQMMSTNSISAAMVMASEVENNDDNQPQLGLEQTASAMILQPSDDDTGFGQFVFRTFGKDIEALSTYTAYENATTNLHIECDDELDAKFLSHIPEVVAELLEREGLAMDDIRFVLPPQRSTQFVDDVGAVLKCDASRVVDATRSEDNLSTSALAHAFEKVKAQAKPGDLALVIAVGSGLQVGCSTYRF